MSEQLIELSDHGDRIVLLRMQSPPVNAWADPFVEAMERTITELEHSPARAVVITGGSSFQCRW